MEHLSLSLTAIALAGGQSSRMGQDKALMSIQGVPLLRRICDIARACTPIVYVVTPRVEQYRSVVADGCQWIQEQSFLDQKMPHGPLIGFAQGLAQVQTDWVLLLACDLPYLQADILCRWMQQLEAMEPGAIALLPRGVKGWEPLCGFYRTQCRVSLKRFIDQGGRSFQRWLAQETVQAIGFSACPEENLREQKLLFNCNTPKDWAMTADLTSPRVATNDLMGNRSPEPKDY